MFIGVLKEVTTHFIVDARKTTKSGGDHVKARIINPSGANTDAYITDKGEGTYRVEYTAYEDGKAESCNCTNSVRYILSRGHYDGAEYQAQCIIYHT